VGGKNCNGSQGCGLSETQASKRSRWESWEQINKEHKEESVAKRTRGAAQKEFDNLPPVDPLAQKAIEYLNGKDRVKHEQDTLDVTKAELIVEFIKTGKSQIKVSGHIVSYSHAESDKIIAKEAL
jgi:hypothetical protein